MILRVSTYFDSINQAWYWHKPQNIGLWVTICLADFSPILLTGNERRHTFFKDQIMMLTEVFAWSCLTRAKLAIIFVFTSKQPRWCHFVYNDTSTKQESGRISMSIKPSSHTSYLIIPYSIPPPPYLHLRLYVHIPSKLQTQHLSLFQRN